MTAEGAGGWTEGTGGAVDPHRGLLHPGACRNGVGWDWMLAAACETSLSEKLKAGRGATLLIGS